MSMQEMKLHNFQASADVGTPECGFHCYLSIGRSARKRIVILSSLKILSVGDGERAAFEVQRIESHFLECLELNRC